MRQAWVWIAAFLLVMTGVSPALGRDYYAKGRNSTTVIDGNETPYEMGVMSAGALFGPTGSGTGGNGSELIRVWTRTQNVREYYNKVWNCNWPYHCVWGVHAWTVEHRFFTTDTRRRRLLLETYNVFPKPKAGGYAKELRDALIDVISERVPYGSVLKALYNGLSVNSIRHYSLSQDEEPFHDWTVVMHGNLAPSVTDLPPEVTYRDADQWADERTGQGSSSSTGAVFNYRFLTREGEGYNLCLWPQVHIQYWMYEQVGPQDWPHTVWAAPMGQAHYVNTNFSASFPNCP